MLFEWRSLDHVDARRVAARQVQNPYDYFHINSIDLAPDGDLLVSARNTWAVYKISRKDGRVLWRLGGEAQRLPDGARRDVRLAARRPLPRATAGSSASSTTRSGPVAPKQSRAIVLELDDEAHGARRSSASTCTGPALYARAMGNAQLLADGGYLVGWGTEPYITRVRRRRHGALRRAAAARRRELPRVPLPVGRSGRRSRPRSTAHPRPHEGLRKLERRDERAHVAAEGRAVGRTGSSRLVRPEDRLRGRARRCRARRATPP